MLKRSFASGRCARRAVPGAPVHRAGAPRCGRRKAHRDARRRSATPASSPSAIARTRSRSPISGRARRRSATRSSSARRSSTRSACELDGKPLADPLSPGDPRDADAGGRVGEVDLECGSTTNNTARQKQVAFSPIIFVSGTKLLVPGATGSARSAICGTRSVVVTAGTTNEQALRAFNDKQKLGLKLVTAPDHDASFKLLAPKEADAFATDDVLLYGWIARDEVRRRVHRAWASTFRTIPTGSCSPATTRSSRLVDRTVPAARRSRELRWIYRRGSSGAS